MLADGYPGHPFIWDKERRFEIRCELDALYFHLYLGTQSDWGCSSQHSPEAPQSNGSHLSLENGGAASAATTHHSPLTTYFKTPRHAVEYIMETFPIVKRKAEKGYGEYRTKRRILEIYNAMTPLFETRAHSPLTTYHSLLDPPPGISAIREAS
jgi:hypothetical protein